MAINAECRHIHHIAIDVGVADGKALTVTIPSQDVTTMTNGVIFVKVNPHNRSLQRAVCKLSSQIDPPDNSLVISSNIGLRDLIRKRNVKQASSLLADGAPRCQLFAAATPEKVKAPPGSGKPNGKHKKGKASPRVSRSQVRTIRDHPEIINVEVDDKDVAVLRCAHPRDRLSVQYDMLTAVVGIMAASAWGEPSIQRDLSLPKGVRAQQGKFYIMNGGEKKRKFFATAEEAAAALADPSSHDSANGAGPDSANGVDAM